jgi:hypothetical protein
MVVRIGFRCIFAPMTRIQIWPTQNQIWVWVSFFTCGCTWNPKKPETRKKSEKTWKKTRNLREIKKPWKKLICKTRRAPEPTETRQVQVRVPNFTCGFGCQFNLTTFFHGSDFWSTRPVTIPIPNRFLALIRENPATSDRTPGISRVINRSVPWQCRHSLRSHHKPTHLAVAVAACLMLCL